MFPASVCLDKIFESRKKQATLSVACFWRRHPDLNWGMKLLQSFALPLGYSAILSFWSGFSQLFANKPYCSCEVNAYRKNLAPTKLSFWSGRRDSNSRHLPWQGNALPLSHSRTFPLLSITSLRNIICPIIDVMLTG